MMRVFTISAQIIARNLKGAIELTLFPAPAVRCYDRDWWWILFLFTKIKSRMKMTRRVQYSEALYTSSGF